MSASQVENEASLYYGLLVTCVEGINSAPRRTLDDVAAVHGGVQIIANDPELTKTWVFPNASAAIAAGIEMRWAVAEDGVQVRLRESVHLISPTTLEPGKRLWSVDGSDPAMPGSTCAPLEKECADRNRPVAATSFIGRQAELASTIEALSGANVVTLTGSGGIGKSRLALQIADQTARLYDDGVCWVDLAPLREPRSVLLAVSRAVGFRLDAESDVVGCLAELLQHRRTLIVLDNCEHLVDACRAMLEQILTTGGGVRVLATSRTPIGLPGEVVRHVPSLSVPESEDALGVSESGRLFIARARAVRPHFAISNDNAVDILSICRQLEGIPLAIELAAARIRVLSPQRIAAGLTRNLGLLDLSESSGASQRTLQASVAWSHTLCSETQQILFRRLAVFVSGFTLEAAEAVCDGAPLNSFAILDLLDQLIDQSIVAVDDARPERRFNLLETIRASPWTASTNQVRAIPCGTVTLCIFVSSRIPLMAESLARPD